MQNNIKTDEMQNIFFELAKNLKMISEAHTGYSQKLSCKKNSLFFTDEKEKKNLAKSYYQYASLLANEVSKMEGSLSRLPCIILDADKEGQQEKIILCDTLLTRYGEFKKAISLFISQNERLLAQDNTSPSEMRNLLSEFGYRLNHFESFLRCQKL